MIVGLPAEIRTGTLRIKIYTVTTKHIRSGRKLLRRQNFPFIHLDNANVSYTVPYEV
jgi:hypothetical protein